MQAIVFAMAARSGLVALGFSGPTTITGLLGPNRLLRPFTVDRGIIPMWSLIIRVVNRARTWTGPCRLRM